MNVYSVVKLLDVESGLVGVTISWLTGGIAIFDRLSNFRTHGKRGGRNIFVPEMSTVEVM